MLEGKNIVLGVTGGIAAYKACELASLLVKQHAGVDVIMTKNATEFVSPLTFDSLTHRRTVTDTFDRAHSYEVEHIALADKADVLVIAPATANVIAKLAYGIADDMLTTTALACVCPKIIAPAMNTKMYENPATQRNLETLRRDGWIIVEPASGHLACGATGKGKLEDPSVILNYILHEIALPHDLSGKKVLVSAGPTEEAIDPVRYVTNHSSGKMGYAIARNAALRGANVTLVSGSTALAAPLFVNRVDIISAQDMYEAITSVSNEQDIIIMAAAIADFRPLNVASEKIKKQSSDDGMSIEMERTKDILAFLGANKKPAQILCGFSMETQNMLENSRKKLEKKNLDLIVANNLKDKGAGFKVDTNLVTIITKDSEKALPLMSKDEVAGKILDTIVQFF
jgi:phosphopantothenoylcysteine decarboxylase/phosphopantothenate--cysteine ligase